MNQAVVNCRRLVNTSSERYSAILTQSRDVNTTHPPAVTWTVSTLDMGQGREGRVGEKLGQIGLKWDKSGTF